MNGFLLVNKPKGISSNQVVQKIKKILLAKKVGHLGTLDPLATGILPIAFGSATKTIPYLVSSKKEYSYGKKRNWNYWWNTCYYR